MEQSLSSLTFRGSIAEAIVEAKNQKKLFVVYVSGDDAESSNLERSTWTNLNVAESVSKYCIMLHIPAGSSDATQFSAIYPQKSVPCITVVGYNGVQLWQNEGFLSAEVLASSLEKAWLSLHLQETTATVLTAALASSKSDATTPGPSDSTLSNLGSSSSAAVCSTDHHSRSPETKVEATPKNVRENEGRGQTLKKNTDVVNKKSETFNLEKSENVANEEPSISIEEVKDLPAPVAVQLDNSRADHIPSNAAIASSVHEKHSNSDEQGDSQVCPQANDSVQEEKTEAIDYNRGDESENSTRDNRTSDVYLNIRLPNGVSLQEKFSIASTLKMVKDYANDNQATGFGTYDLAIPYPRKVFSNQGIFDAHSPDSELGKSLSELGLVNRQALIVVPHHRATSDHNGGSSSFGPKNYSTNGGSSSVNNEGYFAYIKWVLSYANPFSYLRGVASSQESQNGMWQHGPNIAAQNNVSTAERPSSRYPANQSGSAASQNDGRRRQPTSSGFGSNIHTLKRDEDDERFSDRNAFWNGNSTQYGGDNDGK